MQLTRQRIAAIVALALVAIVLAVVYALPRPPSVVIRPGQPATLSTEGRFSIGGSEWVESVEIFTEADEVLVTIVHKPMGYEMMGLRGQVRRRYEMRCPNQPKWKVVIDGAEVSCQSGGYKSVYEYFVAEGYSRSYEVREKD